MGLETRAEIRDFLTSRRARITPDEVGLIAYGTRRVPGLRREEVATLAGVSVDYYNRMERGSLAGASEGVLEAMTVADPGLEIFTYAAEPGSSSEQAFKLLASWTADAGDLVNRASRETDVRDR